MNREIKLRAWCPKNKEMYYADNCRNYENGGYYFDIDNNSIGFYPRYNTDELSRFNTKPSDDEIKILVMTFTGLKDKSVKDIYEGDILENDNGVKYIVVWMEQLAAFYLSIPNTQRGKEIISCAASKVANEPMLLFKEAVIGNIYENPELLKK